MVREFLEKRKATADGSMQVSSSCNPRYSITSRRRDLPGKGTAGTPGDEGQLYAFRHTGFWHPMDTMRDKLLLDSLWKSGKAPWTIRESPDRRVGHDDGKRILAKQERIHHRAHRVQGSWLCLWLRELGANVTGYALPPDHSEPVRTLRDRRPCTLDRGHVRDVERMKSALRASHSEIVFHLAAQPIVRESYANPVETYSTNVMGTVNLLESVRHSGEVRAVVNVTTDKCYENREWVWGTGERTPRRARPVLQQQSLFGTGHRRIQGFLLPPGPVWRTRRWSGIRAGGERDRGGDFAADRLVPDCVRALLKENGSSSGTRRRPAPGSMSWSRSRDISSWPETV